MGIHLWFCSGALGGQGVPLPPEGARIGTAPDCEVVLPAEDPGVAPVHASMAESDGQWIIADAGGGTFVNGRRLAPDETALVAVDDWIMFGDNGPIALIRDAGAPPPRSWVAVQSEAVPDSMVLVADQSRAAVSLDRAGRVRHPAPKGVTEGFRFHLDRTPPVAEPLDMPNNWLKLVPITRGILLKLRPHEPGVRVLAVQADVAARAPEPAAPAPPQPSAPVEFAPIPETPPEPAPEPAPEPEPVAVPPETAPAEPTAPPSHVPFWMLFQAWRHAHAELVDVYSRWSDAGPAYARVREAVQVIRAERPQDAERLTQIETDYEEQSRRTGGFKDPPDDGSFEDVLRMLALIREAMDSEYGAM